MGKEFVDPKNGLIPKGALRGPVPWSRPVETTKAVNRLGRSLGGAEHGFANESKPEGVAQIPVDNSTNQ